MAVVELRDASCGYRQCDVLHHLTLRANAGEFLSLAGPNGAGKSTLLSVLAGLRTDYRGACLLNNRETREWPG